MSSATSPEAEARHARQSLAAMPLIMLKNLLRRTGVPKAVAEEVMRTRELPSGTGRHKIKREAGRR